MFELGKRKTQAVFLRSDSTEGSNMNIVSEMPDSWSCTLYTIWDLIKRYVKRTHQRDATTHYEQAFDIQVVINNQASSGTVSCQGV